MTTINKSALVMHTPEQMYKLVNEVEFYHEFLPWCRSSRSLDRDDFNQRASIEIAKGPLNKSFTTRNMMWPNERIHLALENGPFSKLDGQWRFEALGDKSCKILLEIEFEFSGRLISAVLSPVFAEICSSLIDAFVQRAARVYNQ